MSLRTTLAGMALVAGLGLAASAVHAADPSVTYLVKVRISDLDLGGRADSATALRRIRSAARHVCRQAVPDSGIGAIETFRDCYRSSTDDAVGRLGSPTVSALNDGGRATFMATR